MLDTKIGPPATGKKRHLKLSIGPWPKYAKIPQQYGMTKTLTVKKAGS